MEDDVRMGVTRRGLVGVNAVACVRAGAVVVSVVACAWGGGEGGGGKGPPWGSYAAGAQRARGVPPVTPPTGSGAEKERGKEGVEAAQPPASAGLDELLGLDPQDAPDRAGNEATEAGGDGMTSDSSLSPEQKRALERQLAQGQMAEGFKAAVENMNDAAARVEGRASGGGVEGAEPDVGITTQRLQEEALKNLDAAIQGLQKMQQNSSPSKRQKQNQSQSQRSTSPEREQQGQTQTGDNTDVMDPPGREEGELGADLQGVRAGWGNLPERMREMLMQGSSDSFSATYRTLTQEYFRRLAETGREPRQ